MAFDKKIHSTNITHKFSKINDKIKSCISYA